MTFVIIVATAFAVWQILTLYGVFEIRSENTRVADEIVSNKKFSKQRKRENFMLGLYTNLTNTFRGILMSPYQREKHQYYIARLEIRSEVLDRPLTPEELRGKYFAPFAASIIVIPIAVFIPGLFLVPGALLFYFMTYQVGLDAKIRDEDKIIDDYFIDLYLLLYSKLKQGSRARLQGTVENYIDTLQGSGDVEIREVMLKLSRYLLNLLSLYEDHVAVPKLREIYHSATIINFCNIAGQALNGVENHDNLLTFKMQLINRKTEVMKIKSAKIVRQGEMSIYAIYGILAIFIVVGFWSKLPTGMLSMF